MKRAIAVFALATLLSGIIASSASAYYYMGYGQAKRETKIFEEEICNESYDCVGVAVGFPCYRKSRSAFDCVMGIFHEDSYGKTECNTVLHWGVTRGYIDLKATGEPYCFEVY